MIKVTTQKELDAVSVDTPEKIEIHGGTIFDKIVVSKKYYYSVVARENSSVVARENSSVVARGNSSVVAWGNSSVVAWGNSSVVARGNSSVEARENSSVVAWENSSVVARENSSVEARGNSSVEAWGNVGVHAYSDVATISLFFTAVCWKHVTSRKVFKKSKTATILTVPPFKATFADFKNRFPITVKGKTVVAYKAVHKYPDGTYHSDHSKNFTYSIGQEIIEKCDSDIERDCSNGIHIAFKSWARKWGASWSDFALLEVETNVKDIVVPRVTDGKIRTSKIKVIREVPKTEWFKN